MRAANSISIGRASIPRPSSTHRQSAHQGRQDSIRDEDHSRREQTPDHDRVPCDAPQHPRRIPEILLERGRDHGEREGGRLLSKQVLAGAVERNEQEDLQRINQIVDELNRRQVELEGKSCDGAQDGRGAEHRKDAQHDAERNAQRNFFGRRPHLEQPDDGLHHFSLPDSWHRS